MGAEFVITLMGPTASGKSAASLLLAERFGCEIITVDSAQVFKGMDIGTAKPSIEEQQRIRHHLLDIRDPAENYSVAEFRKDALFLIDEILARGNVPLLVGGTNLYFRALLQGLSDLPAANAEIRAEIEVQAQSLGWVVMHQYLQNVDPVSAARIHSTDSQRIQRALEVYKISGKTMTELYQLQESASVFPYRNVKIIMAPQDRSWLHQRIAVRFKQMLEQGIVSEVQSLYLRGDLTSDLPAVRAVGYRQVWAYLENKYDERQMHEKAVIATRQLAKRQLTWLRKEQDATWFECSAAGVLAEVERFVARQLHQ